MGRRKTVSEIDIRLRELEESLKIQTETTTLLSRIADLLTERLDVANARIRILEEKVEQLRNGDDLK